jgi:hypothetical protein
MKEGQQSEKSGGERRLKVAVNWRCWKEEGAMNGDVVWRVVPSSSDEQADRRHVVMQSASVTRAEDGVFVSR